MLRRRCRGNSRGESVLHIDEFTSQSNPSCHSTSLLLSPSAFLDAPPGGKFQPPNSGLWYRREVVPLRCRFLSLFFERPIGALDAIPSPLPRPAFARHLSPFHIDEFIVGTARPIVTKIVYDIDSSFYVNPVSEWFCLTQCMRGESFCTRNRTKPRSCMRVHTSTYAGCSFSVRVASLRVNSCANFDATRGTPGMNYRRIYEETDGSLELTVLSRRVMSPLC